MKKCVIVAVLLGIGMCAQAGLIDWGSQNFNNPIGGDPKANPIQDGWTVAIYQDVSGDNSGGWQDGLRLNLTDGSVNAIGTAGTANDVLIGSNTTMSVSVIIPSTLEPIVLNSKSNIDLADNIQIYSVIFNASSIAAATSNIVIDAATFDSGTAAFPTPAVTYDVGADLTGSWTAMVPEPTTIGLVSLFAVSALVVRRFRRY